MKLWVQVSTLIKVCIWCLLIGLLIGQIL